MKRTKILVASFVVMLVGVIGVGLTNVAQASNFRSGPSSTVTAQETIDGTAYLAGQTVTVNGTVNGDLFCAAQTVIIDATVNGDVICAGQTVIVKGDVKGNVRLAGQTVTLSGAVERNATVAAQTLIIDSSAKIGGDVTSTGESAMIRGQIGRDLVVGSTSLQLDSTVGRNVTATVDDLVLTTATKVAGNFNYTSQKSFTISSDQVAGSVTRQAVAADTQKDDLWSWVSAFLVTVAALIVLTAGTVLVAPRGIRAITDASFVTALKRFLLGLGLLIGVPIVAVLLFLSFIGMWLAFVLVIAWLAVLAIAPAVFSYYVGRAVLQRNGKHVLLVALVGAVITGALLWVPVVGFVVMLLIAAAGSGMIVSGLGGQRRSESYRIVRTEVAVAKKK